MFTQNRKGFQDFNAIGLPGARAIRTRNVHLGARETDADMARQKDQMMTAEALGALCRIDASSLHLG